MKISTLLLGLITLLSSSQVFAQAPDCAWIRTTTGTRSDTPFSIDTDSEGNVYTAGFYTSSSLAFGPVVLTNTTTTALFIVKHSPTGELLWSKTAQESASFGRISLTVDAEDQLYVAGGFMSKTITFGTTVLTNTNENNSDLFLIKFDADGQVLWAKATGGVAYDESSAVTTDSDGNVYVTGFYYSPSIVFDTYTLTKNAGDYYNVFTVKYDSEGNVLWAKTSHGDAFDRSMALTVDENNNVYVTGFFRSTTFSFDAVSLTNNTSWDVFVVKYAVDGNVLWAKAYGGSGDDHPSGIVIGGDGNVYLSGYYESSNLTFGSVTLNNTGTTTADVFLAKLDPDGNVLWAQPAGGTLDEISTSLVTDVDGNIITTGGFMTPALSFGSFTVSNADSISAYAVKYTTEGNVLWAKSMSSGGGKNALFNAAPDAYGNLYVSGIFSGPSLTCDAITAEQPVHNTAYDVFIARLGALPTSRVDEQLVDVSIFPNPTQGKLKLSGLQEDAGNVCIYSSIGEKIYESTIDATQLEIDLSGYNRGIYTCHLQDEKGRVVTRKIIVQ